MSQRVQEMKPLWLLNEGVAASFERGTARLVATAGVEIVAQGHEADGHGFQAVPLLLATSASTLPDEATEECFGPVAVVARYSDEGDLLRALQKTPASLAATVLRSEAETELPARISEAFRSKAGRLVYDGYPTGVAVTWAQHHGGPWPSTNAQHTSVGTTAIRRFLRPMTWQNAPADLLPRELLDECTEVPRRVNGALRLAETRPQTDQG
jgi:NADP-dependent aldehyde dehydrogenase